MDAGVLRVRVTRPPADGEANRAVQRLIARALDLPPSGVRLLSGERSRRKRFAIDQLSTKELAARLSRLDEPGD
jgi:hypothetical protein